MNNPTIFCMLSSHFRSECFFSACFVCDLDIIMLPFRRYVVGFSPMCRWLLADMPLASRRYAVGFSPICRWHFADMPSAFRRYVVGFSAIFHWLDTLFEICFRVIFWNSMTYFIYLITGLILTCRQYRCKCWHSQC